LLSSLFLSKNQKLVRKWKAEHEEIVVLVHKVLAEYAKNNHRAAKKALIELNNVVVDHVTDENIEFFRILKDKERYSLKNREATEEFVSTFKDMRLDLMRFLTHYTKKKSVLDDEFFDTLNGIADVLSERIKFEEENLYYLLDVSRSEEKKRDEMWEQIKKMGA
jgi:hypothetical protein